MADVSQSSGEFVYDAVPEPPRISNFDTLVEENTNQDQKREKSTNIPYIDKNDSTTENTSKPKTKNMKYSTSKKKTKSRTSYNIIDCVNVKIGSTVKHVINLNNYQNVNCATSNTSDDKKPREMHSNIEAFSKSKKEITQNDMFIVQDHIGNGWRVVAKKIGFSQGQIDQLLEDHKHKGIREVVYQLLNVWKLSRTKDATVGELVYAMWSAEEYECVEKLAKAHNVF